MEMKKIAFVSEALIEARKEAEKRLRIYDEARQSKQSASGEQPKGSEVEKTQ